MLDAITIGQARVFRDVVDLQSVSLAAKANGISQSAVSQHLKDLETRLGVELLNRKQRPFTLLSAGRLYYEFCKDVVRKSEQLRNSIAQPDLSVAGKVRLACIYSVLPDLSRLEREFHVRNPKSRMTTEFLEPEEVYEAVGAGRADLGVLSYAAQRRNIRAIPWREEVMHVVMPPGHSLAPVKRLRPETLQDQSFVAFDHGLPVRRDIDRYLREHDVEVDVVLHFASIQPLKEAIELGHGISILPAPAIKAEVAQGRLVVAPLTEPLYRPMAIIFDRRKPFSPAAEECIRMMHESVAAQDDGLVRPPAVRANGHSGREMEPRPAGAS